MTPSKLTMVHTSTHAILSPFNFFSKVKTVCSMSCWLHVSIRCISGVEIFKLTNQSLYLLNVSSSLILFLSNLSSIFYFVFLILFSVLSLLFSSHSPNFINYFYKNKVFFESVLYLYTNKNKKLIFNSMQLFL